MFWLHEENNWTHSQKYLGLIFKIYVIQLGVKLSSI